MNKDELAGLLRRLAIQAEDGAAAAVSIFHHKQDIHDEYGDMVTDATYRGTSYVIHFGDQAYADDAALAERLMDKRHQPPNVGPPEIGHAHLIPKPRKREDDG